MGYQNPWVFDPLPLGRWSVPWPLLWSLWCLFWASESTGSGHRWKKGGGMMDIKTNQYLGYHGDISWDTLLYIYNAFWSIFQLPDLVCFEFWRGLVDFLGCWTGAVCLEVLPFRSLCTCECPDDDHRADRWGASGWSPPNPPVSYLP